MRCSDQSKGHARPARFSGRETSFDSPMDQFAKETIPISLEEEMRKSYLDYAMSVIVGRALRMCAMA